jgi:hypothetical protein
MSGSTMRAYRCHVAFVSLFLTAYVLLGGVLRFARASGEVFPISSWTLFMRVPNQVTEYGIEILAVEGAVLAAPRAFHEARDLFPGAGDVRADRVVQRMARALEGGDEARLRELRLLFEGRWLGAERAPVHYRLVRRSYAPLERWRTGRAAESTELQDFVSGEAS